ncbi:MAG: hypothetical protein WBV93_05610 [Anaerobacillus sp.]
MYDNREDFSNKTSRSDLAELLVMPSGLFILLTHDFFYFFPISWHSLFSALNFVFLFSTCYVLMKLVRKSLGKQNKELPAFFVTGAYFVVILIGSMMFI